MRSATKRPNPSGPSEPKRTRFASPSDPSSNRATSAQTADLDDQDELLEEDLPEGAAQAKRRSKRQLKDQEGYESDSSDDDEGVVPSRRPGAKDEDGDEEMDMFADDVDDKPDEGKAKGKGKGKDKEFLDMDDIEGQEFDRDRQRGGTTDESDSEDEVEGVEGDENVRLGRKKAKEKDLGFEVTPFNMKAEMDEGRFTADGEAYVENERDPNDKHDVWLVDLDKEEIKKARKAHKEREKQEEERERAEEAGVGKERQIELMRAAVELMERGETVLEALQRIGKEVEEKRRKAEEANGQGKKKSWAERQRERKAAMAQDELECVCFSPYVYGYMQDRLADQIRKDSIHTSNPFTNLSNIVSGLTAIGQLDVYSLSRESIQRMLPSQPTNGGSNGNSATSSSTGRAAPDTRQFEYRFSMAYIRNLPEGQRPVEREVFGMSCLQSLQCYHLTTANDKDRSQCSNCNNGGELVSLVVQHARMSSCAKQEMIAEHGVRGRMWWDEQQWLCNSHNQTRE